MVRKEYEHKATLVDGLPVLYCKFGKNKPWVNITSTRFNITDLSFKDKDNVTHSISECEVTINELVVKILLNFDVSQILFKNEVVWSFYRGFWSGYPKYILFDLLCNLFLLVFDHGIVRKLDTKFTDRKHLEEKELKRLEEEFGLFVFKGKPEVVNYGDELIWKHLPGEPLPDMMLVDQETGEIVIFCEDRYFVVRREHGTISRDQHEFTQFHKKLLSIFNRKTPKTCFCIYSNKS
ncbi:hypothetical protein TpMuguga_03g00099 [Theileria parva strain Muguga]|uniref:Uncharacterized protein n=1 Tax=Theileria parva TaxID=5875 RepID=Q4MZ96_THEPA|nr:uncharacterized protein TpMuguga_03g00099 [Theileria parva strain Muguga]EAN30834.1 hypothetical protein TpMuguga_03g00099 [Theileria parva strain Muguga]|eukprot:XP_763117.1 hypothetical protein [Theileria parva strain Muguga]